MKEENFWVLLSLLVSAVLPCTRASTFCSEGKGERRLWGEGYNERVLLYQAPSPSASTCT